VCVGREGGREGGREEGSITGKDEGRREGENSQAVIQARMKIEKVAIPTHACM
jgi:predicted transposase YdaD